MRTCMYLRKSRADRDNPNVSEEEVLKRHEETLLAYAKVNNLDIVEIKKEVVSGEKLSRRPEMLKLLEELEDDKYDAVLVMDFDRLGRGNMMEQGLIINAFKESNTKIITPNKIYDLDDDFDEEYLDISAFFARKELKMITKRLLRGRMKSLEEGNYISPYAPLGYDKKDKTLVINHEQAEIIKMIFDLYVNKGMGDTKISKYLEENNILNKNGKVKWDKTTIRKIIQNPVYIGKVTWGKREYKYNENGKRSSSFLDKSEWKIFEGKHEAIVDEELFKKAQLLTKERYQPHLKKARVLRNPLSYFLKCSSCGATMSIRTCKGKKDSIRCYKGCGTKSSYLYLVEDRLIKLLYKRLTELEYNFTYNKSEFSSHEINVINDTIICNEKELKKILNQKDKLFDLLEQGIYDNLTFLERMNKISNRIEAVEKTISEARKKQEQFFINKENIENKIPMIKSFKDYIDNVYWNNTPEEKNVFLREIIKYANYTKYPDADMDDFELQLFLKI